MGCEAGQAFKIASFGKSKGSDVMSVQILIQAHLRVGSRFFNLFLKSGIVS